LPPIGIAAGPIGAAAAINSRRCTMMRAFGSCAQLPQ